jgi:hypothetical protein
MINLHFHWAWIPFVILIIVGLFFFFRENGKDPMGFNAFGGCLIFLVCILAALVIGGIWLW